MDSSQLGLLKDIGIQVQKSLPLCVILDVKIDLVQLHGAYLDVLDYVEQTDTEIANTGKKFQFVGCNVQI